MNELALFAGAGGGILGGQILGWRTVCAVEIDPYAASVLLARQSDGLLPPFPVWDDVRTFDGSPWRGIVDVVSGGFPCQDISAAGKAAGIEGSRSGLWSEFARIIGEVRPRFAFVENSPILTSRGLGIVLGDLAEMGFDARWGVLGAADVGAPHKRERIWIVSHAHGEHIRELSGRECGEDRAAEPTQPQHDGEEGVVAAADKERWIWRSGQLRQTRWAEPQNGCNEMADSARFQPGREEQRAQREQTRKGGQQSQIPDAKRDRWERTKYKEPREGAPDLRRRPSDQGWWQSEPDVGRVAHGVAARVDRLRCLGNGQVPQCAAEAWRLLSGGLTP